MKHCLAVADEAGERRNCAFRAHRRWNSIINRLKSSKRHMSRVDDALHAVGSLVWMNWVRWEGSSTRFRQNTPQQQTSMYDALLDRIASPSQIG